MQTKTIRQWVEIPTIFSDTWRIYVIEYNKTLDKFLVSDGSKEFELHNITATYQYLVQLYKISNEQIQFDFY